MKTDADHRMSELNTSAGVHETTQPSKKTWTDPKLKFVEPKLTRHGGLERLTGGFIGTFSP